MSKKDLLILTMRKAKFRTEIIDAVKSKYTEDDLKGISINDFIVDTIIKHNLSKFPSLNFHEFLSDILLRIGYTWQKANELEQLFIENVERFGVYNIYTDVVQYSLS